MSFLVGISSPHRREPVPGANNYGKSLPLSRAPESKNQVLLNKVSIRYQLGSGRDRFRKYSFAYRLQA
jgi:hypothetical protein